MLLGLVYVKPSQVQTCTLTEGGRDASMMTATKRGVAFSHQIEQWLSSETSKMGDGIGEPTFRALSEKPIPNLAAHFFGKPTLCARVIAWLSESFSALASAGRSIKARTPVASPSEAANR